MVDALLTDTPVLRVVGELTDATSAGVHTALAAFGEEPRLIVDLTDVPFADGAGLGRLVGAINRLRRAGRMVAVVTRGGLTRAFEAAGAAGLIPTARSLDEARRLLATG